MALRNSDSLQLTRPKEESKREERECPKLLSCASTFQHDWHLLVAFVFAPELEGKVQRLGYRFSWPQHILSFLFTDQDRGFSLNLGWIWIRIGINHHHEMKWKAMIKPLELSSNKKIFWCLPVVTVVTEPPLRPHALACLWRSSGRLSPCHVTSQGRFLIPFPKHHPGPCWTRCPLSALSQPLLLSRYCHAAPWLVWLLLSTQRHIHLTRSDFPVPGTAPSFNR